MSAAGLGPSTAGFAVPAAAASEPERSALACAVGDKLLNLEADVYSLFNYQYALDLDPSTSLWTYCGWR